MLTNGADQTKTTIPWGGSDAYQTLPDRMLAVRICLVRLVWSTNCYHLPDLALHLPRIAFTKPYHRGEGDGIKPNRPSRVGQYTQHRGRGCHMGNVVKGIHSIERWHTVEHSGEP